MPVIGTTMVRAFATLTATADANIVEAETVVIGGITYTFDATLDAVNDVPFVTAFAPNMAALVKVINVTGTVLTDYYTAQAKNPYVHAVLLSSGVITLYSRIAGLHGNLVTVTIGTSATTLTDDSSGTLDTGAGSLDEEFNILQAEAQINSDVAAFIHALEVDPDL